MICNFKWGNAMGERDMCLGMSSFEGPSLNIDVDEMSVTKFPLFQSSHNISISEQNNN